MYGACANLNLSVFLLVGGHLIFGGLFLCQHALCLLTHAVLGRLAILFEFCRMRFLGRLFVFCFLLRTDTRSLQPSGSRAHEPEDAGTRHGDGGAWKSGMIPINKHGQLAAGLWHQGL